MTRLLVDFDYMLYSAGSAGETRTVKVVHRESGDEYEFSTRTLFYGHWKTKAGGWLAEYNAAKAEHNRRKADEFDYFDVQTPEPIENCLHTLKQMITGVKETVGAKSHYGYSGTGDTFRNEVATIWGYKANRVGALRPVHLDGMKDYLVKKHNCEIIREIEADDACSIDSWDAWKRWKKTGSDSDKLVLAAIDKDAKGTTCHLYNPNKPEKGVCSHDGYGWLTWDEKKKEADGRGRLWLYYQVMSGDSADNYAANSASTMKWGDKSGFDTLKDAKTDKEAFEALVRGYKTIYPNPKAIVGWRGYEDPKDMKILKPDWKEHSIEVDWKAVLQENFTLAKMLRWRGDNIDVMDVMKRLNIDY